MKLVTFWQKLIFCCVLVPFLQIEGQCSVVSNFQELDDAISNQETTINIVDDITFSSDISTSPITSNITIEANKHILDGNSTQQGFSFQDNNVSINNIEMDNFKKAKRGVAISLDNATLKLTNSIFKSNSSDGDYAGAISLMNNSTANIYNSIFENNSAKTSGVLYSKDSTLNIYNSSFKNNKTTESQGGVLTSYNNSTLGVYNSIFENNFANSNGGAVSIRNANVTIDNTAFKGNSAQTGGGAVYVYAKDTENNTLKIYNSVFENNSAKYGGAVYMYSKTGSTNSVDINNTKFVGNKAAYSGGAVYVYSKDTAVTTVNISNSLFENNTTTSGDENIDAWGTVYQYNSNVSINNTIFRNNKTDGSGSAIYSNGGTLNVNNSIFENNTGFASRGTISVYRSKTNISNSIFRKNIMEQASAIYFYPLGETMSVYNSSFIENKILPGTNKAIGTIKINDGENGNVNIYNSLFKGNEGGNPDSHVGSAILIVTSANLNIYDSSFINNKTLDGKKQGAIVSSTWTETYKSNPVVNIASINGNTYFGGNSTSDNGNVGVYNGFRSTLNLYAGSGTSIIFDDKIVSNKNSKFTINGDVPSNMDKRTGNSGTVVFNADMRQVESATDFYNGTIQIGRAMGADETSGYTNFVGGAFKVYNSPTLSMMNGAINKMDASKWNISNNLNLKIDVDIANRVADYIDNNSLTGIMTIDGLNIYNEAGKFENLEIPVTNDGTNFVLSDRARTVETPMFIYAVNDTNLVSKGVLGFKSTNRFSPAVLTSSVGAQVGAYLSQVNVNEEVFANYDSIMALSTADRIAYKYRNRYAIQDVVGEYRKPELLESSKGMWYRPYTTFESVNLSNGPMITSIGYGMLAGGDSGIISLKRGWDAVYSAYIGYNGSHQSYSNVGIDQNGGVLGIGAMFFRDKFFGGLTANVGANVANATNKFGEEDFTTLASSVAGKIGYNLEFLEGKLILQPNFMMSYTFVNTFDYTNSSGYEISSDPIHAIQIVPGIKLIGNLKKSWQPYLSLQMVWNAMDKTHFRANEVSLPQMSIDPYFQYGLGLQKKVGDRFTGFGQAMLRAGGRAGVAFTFGFRWAL